MPNSAVVDAGPSRHKAAQPDFVNQPDRLATNISVRGSHFVSLSSVRISLNQGHAIVKNADPDSLTSFSLSSYVTASSATNSHGARQIPQTVARGASHPHQTG